MVDHHPVGGFRRSPRRASGGGFLTPVINGAVAFGPQVSPMKQDNKGDEVEGQGVGLGERVSVGDLATVGSAVGSKTGQETKKAGQQYLGTADRPI